MCYVEVNTKKSCKIIENYTEYMSELQESSPRTFVCIQTKAFLGK